MSVESQKRKQDEALYSSKDAGNKRPRQDVTNMPRKAMPQLARQQYHRWAQSSAHVPPNISYAHSPPISAFEYPHLPGAEQYRQQQFGPALDLGAHGSRTSPSHPGREENRQKQPGPTPVARGTRDDPLDLDSMPDTYNLLPQAQITNSYVQDHTPPTSLPNRYVKVCNNALPQQEGGVKLNAAEYKIAEKRAAYQPPADIGRESSGLCAIRDGWQGKVSIPDGWHGTIPDKYYAVLHGRDPGLYTTFEEAVDATMGHPGPQVMACASLQEVSEWMDIPPHDRKMKPSSSHEYRLHKSLPSQRPHEARPFAVPAELLEKVPSFETRVTGTAIPFEDENRLQATLPISTAYPPSPPPSYTAATITAPTDIVPIVEPDLCPEQADLVDIILSGRNVFYTGSAGCGKSTVLKAFVKRFNAIGKKVNIVAPTGRAALDINGSTTWTYAGM